jgi:hypothetical protein
MLAPIVRKSLSVIALTSFAALGACQADYGADIHNKTSTPIFAQLMVKANDHNQPAVLGASRRLGPGDRGAVGPVRANARPGSVYLLVDSLPNPSKPSGVDLAPGTAFLEVNQDGNGPLRIQEKP